MSGSVPTSVHFPDSKGVNEASCKVTDPNGAICGETESLRILEQFQRVYAERLKRLDGDNELAMHTLKSWVHDLTEQNTMLVHTVEELERELLKRVDLMHDQLQKTSLVIKRNEHLAKREKNEVEVNLRQQVQLLQNDVSSLLDIINQAKEQGFWSVDSVKLHTISKSQLMSTSPKRSMQQAPAESAADQKSGQRDMDNLKTQLAEKDAEIHNLLERIEEMQDIFTLTSKQVKQAVEAEQKSMQELATSHGTVCVNLQSKEVDSSQFVDGVSPWIEERLKQQQQQVTALISRVRELESNYDILKIERDHLAGKLVLPKVPLNNDVEVETQTTTDPSMITLSKDLVTTRQQLSEATKQVQILASAVKDLEKKNYETKAALTTEVADKHDQILELRREMHDLEEQVKEAKMQTNFKDSIIQGMRNELKVIRNKNSSESGSDVDSKSRRKGFPAIPEANSVCDSGLDEGELSSSSNSLQAEVNLLRSQLNENLKQILEKDQELVAQRERVFALEKELVDRKKASAKAPQVPSITLRELEEYRLCTVEGQAAVEELNDEIDVIVSDLKSQEEKVSGIQEAASTFLAIMQNAQEELTQAPPDPASVHKALSDAVECARDVHQKSEAFVRERRAGEQRRAARERKVSKLQEQLDTSHDNMRDGIEAMEQALGERYEADRLSQREFSDGSSYHSCRDSDSSGCLKQVERLEESNAELLNNLTSMERQKRDAEAKASQCLRELERMKEQVGRRSFTEELLHTKEQTICELQGALDSTRRQMKDLQSDFERTARERDSIKSMLEQQSNAGPLQVAELQSELARVRNQLASMNSKQALVEQYERRLKDSSEQAEKLSAQLNTLALNLQAKETMLSNKEEMVNILQDTLDRTREEMKMLKDKSVSKSSFALPWRNGKKKMGGPSSSTDKGDPDEAVGTVGAGTDEQWEIVRELKLDLSEMLAQYQDCFSEVSRQTRWYRDLREAYQDLRSHAENVKREALLTVNSSQREVEVLKRQCKTQSLQICQLKEQLWEAEQSRQRADSETDELQGRLENYSQQICQFKSRLESLQTQLKDTQARMEISEEQVELRRLRDFRDKWERVARSLADIDNQDKDCWSGLQWCESSESEDSQKREAKLEATLGLLLVEAGRRHRANANGGREAAVKDCDSRSTDGSASGSASGSTKSRDREAKPTAEAEASGSDSQQQQGKLQGVLEENQQLRDQLEQLRSHNASLALQLQEQYDESARCLADISSSLSTEANIDGVVSRRGPLAPRGSLEEDEKQPSLVTPPRGPGVHGHALHGHGRVSRASSCGSSSGGSSRGVVGRPPRLDQHHGVHLPYHRRQRAASPDAVAPGPWDYSDHADLCDSGFWSLQASPPRSSSVLAAALSPASAASHTAPSTPTPARLCWLGRSASPAAPETLISPPPGPGGTFILSTRRPRPSRH